MRILTGLSLLWVSALSMVVAAEDLHLRKRQLEGQSLPQVSEEGLVVHDTTESLDLLVLSAYDKIAPCFGDCDSSEDCQEGLVCYHRDIDDEDDSAPVPGCSESDNRHIHTTNSVCVAKDDLPVHALSRTAPVRRNLMSLCRGDCDEDSDCDGSLVCQQRDRGDPVRGCSGKNRGTTRDYCVRPSSSSNNNGGDLGQCEGDCNRDSDCSGSLVCKQRDAYDPIPSGCRGRLSWSTDYCVSPSSTSTNNDNGRQSVSSPATMSSASFRLKIYWEEGYDWQDEGFERRWCLSRDVNEGGTCWHGLERRTCESDRLYVVECSSSSRQEFNFEHVNGEEALIRATGQDRCLHRSGTDISLRSCNPDSSSQRFIALNGGFTSNRFELSQNSASRYCLNQDHHPKNNEYVQMFPCTWTRSRDSLTSYWERY